MRVQSPYRKISEKEVRKRHGGGRKHGRRKLRGREAITDRRIVFVARQTT